MATPNPTTATAARPLGLLEDIGQHQLSTQQEEFGVRLTDLQRDVFGDQTNAHVDGPGNGLLGVAFNADQEYEWETAPISMNLAPMVEEEKTCGDRCRDIETKRRENCRIIIKRVKESLKKAGCDVEIKMKPRRNMCGGGSRRDSRSSTSRGTIAARARVANRRRR